MHMGLGATHFHSVREPQITVPLYYTRPVHMSISHFELQLRMTTLIQSFPAVPVTSLWTVKAIQTVLLLHGQSLWRPTTPEIPQQ